MAAEALSCGQNANILRLGGGANGSWAREDPQCARRFVPVPLATALAEPAIRIDLRCGSGTLVAGVGCVRVCGAATRGDGQPRHPKQPGHGYPPNRSE